VLVALNGDRNAENESTRSAVADYLGVSEIPETKASRHVAISGHVPTELAESIRRLAERGNRSVSRQVTQALREHVAAHSSAGQASTSSPPAASEETAERRVPSGQSTTRAHGGERE
jgi:hypothetical protein